MQSAVSICAAVCFIMWAVLLVPLESSLKGDFGSPLPTFPPLQKQPQSVVTELLLASATTCTLLFNSCTVYHTAGVSILQYLSIPILTWINRLWNLLLLHYYVKPAQWVSFMLVTLVKLLIWLFLQQRLGCTAGYSVRLWKHRQPSGSLSPLVNDH